MGYGFDTCLIDNQDLAHSCVQDGFGVLLGFAERTSHEICRILYNNWNHNVRHRTAVLGGRGLFTFPVANKAEVRQDLTINLRDGSLSGTRVPQENAIQRNFCRLLLRELSLVVGRDKVHQILDRLLHGFQTSELLEFLPRRTLGKGSGRVRSDEILLLEKEIVRLETFPSFLRESGGLAFRDLGEEQLQVTSVSEALSTPTTSKSPGGDPAIQAPGVILDLHALVPFLLDLLLEHEKKLVVFVIGEVEFVRDAAREPRVVLEELFHLLAIPGEDEYQLSDVVLHLR